MRDLAAAKTKLVLKTGVTVQGRPLVVGIHPWGLTIRQHRSCGAGYTMDWQSIYERAVKIAVEEQRSLGKAKRGKR